MTAKIPEQERILRPILVVSALWLVALPLLRPWLWQGDATDQANLIYIVFLAAATATGLVYRAIAPEIISDVRPWWGRSWPWCGVFLLVAFMGAWWGPMPAKSYALVVGWFFHIAAPLALFPLIIRWPQFVFAGLMAGCAGELALMLGQALWERPALQQVFATDPALSAEKRFADQFQVRVEHWRLEGSFLLANTLATYFLCLIPLIIGAVVQRWQQNKIRVNAQLCSMSIFLLLTLVGFAFTGSKAAFVAALATAILGVLLFSRQRLMRWGIISVVVLISVVAFFIPVVHKSIHASALVRTQYWDAALLLIQEQPITGYGWYGFEQHYPRVKSAAAEETIVVHNELLEVAVSLGIPAALLLLVWWVIGMRSLWPRPISISLTGESLPVRTALIGTALLLFFAFFMTDVLRASFSFYPGAIPALWALVFIILGLAGARWVMTWPLPSALWWWCSFCAVSVHALADFSLQSMQVVGPLAWVGCLAVARGGYVQLQPRKTEQPLRSIGLALSGMGLLAVVMLGVMMTSERTNLRQRAQQALNIVQRLQVSVNQKLSAEQNEQLMIQLERHAALIVAEDGAEAMAEDMSETIIHGYVRKLIAASSTFPRDNELSFLAINIAHQGQLLFPSKAHRFTEYFEQLVQQWPHQLSCLQALSDHYVRRAEQTTGAERHAFARRAQALSEQVVRGYPAHLPFRRQLIRAAKLTGDQATVEREESIIVKLHDQVHPDNR
jgi:O-antigen ligase